MAAIGLDRLIAGSAGVLPSLRCYGRQNTLLRPLRLHLGPDHPWNHFLVANIERFALTVFP